MTLQKITTVSLALSLAAVTVVASALTGVHPPIASASTSWPVLSSSNSSYPTKVDFVTACKLTQAGNFDPVVSPGVPGGHRHSFSGATSVNPSSTSASLLAGGTNCSDNLNKSSYWMPSVYRVKPDGTATLVEPYEDRAYYRAQTFNGKSLHEVPFGLKVIAGNSKATSAQSAGVAGWQCRTLASGNVGGKSATPPSCNSANQEFLEASVIYPNCWDGKNLDSADHKSHMSYATPSGSCDTAHPVRLPGLTFAERFPVGAFDGGKPMVIAAADGSFSPYTLHSDYISAWTPSEMTYLTRNCLQASVACATITDSHRPPVAR